MAGRLDVVIPTYNRPRLVERCVTSALALSVEGLRVVVIDDGSNRAESLDDGTRGDTPSVLQRFDDPRLVYHRIEPNGGLGGVFETYRRELIGSPYMIVVNDDDVFIDGAPIEEALSRLEADNELALVQISLIRRSDDRNIDQQIELPYPTLSSRDFLRTYIRDEPVKHTTMYGIFRTENIARTDALVSMGLRRYGLEDAFGIDTDFLFRMASCGKTSFVNRPHVLRRETEGLTERYPVSFAYCYYQYILRGLTFLRRRDLIDRADARDFVRYWMKVTLMMLAASMTAPTALERGEERIRQHLRYPLHLYIALQMLRFGFWPDAESRQLFVFTLRRRLGLPDTARKKTGKASARDDRDRRQKERARREREKAKRQRAAMKERAKTKKLKAKRKRGGLASRIKTALAGKHGQRTH